MEYIVEKERKTPVVDEVDVLVAGGGFAGVSAALAAVRQGKKVLLCQKEYMLGGLGTAGLVTIYLPLCDGRGHQVSFGIVEELFHLSIRGGVEGKDPSAWLNGGSKEERIKKRFQAQYNPWIFAVDLEQLLKKEGVEILYGTLVCDTVVEAGKIRYVIIENIDGRGAVKVKSVVDATGDAVVCALAGEETVENPDLNVPSSWYYYVSEGKVQLKMFGPSYMPGKAPDWPHFSGLNAKENSEMMMYGRQKMLQDIMQKREADPGLIPVTVPSIQDLRMTRRIAGVKEVRCCDGDKYVESSVGCFGNWHKAGPAYEVPYESLYGRRVKNLITAGRCSAADQEAWDLTRVIPVCAVTGEAAGIAAAMTDDFASLPVKQLQDVLEAKGVKLHLKELIED